MEENRKNENMNSMPPETEQAPKKKKYNILPKVICFLAAFVLWFYVMQVESPQYTSTISSVTVELEGVSSMQSASGFSVYSGGSESVTVTISGKRSVISSITSDSIHAYADVSGITKAGRNAVPVTVELPTGATLAEVSPSTVNVYVDETSTVSLDIEEKFENFVLTSPYELGTVTYDYDTVTVSGPKNITDTLTGAQIVIDMTGKEASFTASCPVQLLKEDGTVADQNYLTLSVSTLDVNVPIYLTQEVQVTTSFRYGYLDSTHAKVTVDPETVTVKADPTVFSSNQVIVPTIVIDEKQITGSTYTVNFTPAYDSNLTVADDDKEITVTVELDSSMTTKEFVVSDITASNVPADLTYEILSEELTVTLRGTSAELKALEAADISLVCDLSGYAQNSTGTVTVAAAVVVDSDSAVFEIGNYYVQIRLNV